MFGLAASWHHGNVDTWGEGLPGVKGAPGSNAASGYNRRGIEEVRLRNTARWVEVLKASADRELRLTTEASKKRVVRACVGNVPQNVYRTGRSAATPYGVIAQ